jgi:hypothetical protein
MLSNTFKKYINSFSIHNNIIIPSAKTLKKMNMSRQEYMFFKWSYDRDLRKKNILNKKKD